MIRIDTEYPNAQEVMLKIHGHLTEASVGVLAMEGARWLERGQRLVVDLAGVKFIDEAGLVLLEQWPRPRLQICRAPPFIATLLAQRGLSLSD